MGRISALTELTSLASDDYLVVLDSSANIAKKITIANAFGIPTLGYTATGESWTYATATTITVPTDATTKYQRGNIIKITQATGGTKYGVITIVAATLLTIEWLNGATLVNEAITSPFYSSNATPLGAGGIAHEMLSTASDWSWDTWTPTWTNLTLGNGTLTAKYKQVGKTVQVHLKLVFGTTTSISGDATFSLPVTRAAYGGTANLDIIGQSGMYDTSLATFVLAYNTTPSTTTTNFRIMGASGTYVNPSAPNATTPFTWDNTDEISSVLLYEAA